MVKEKPQEIEKAWGHETVLFAKGPEEVLRAGYCVKLLHLHKGACSSRHIHKWKKESFYCLEGTVVLTVDGKSYLMTPFSRPKTVSPGEEHSFFGASDAILLEGSTGDDPTDVERFTESRAGVSWR